MAAFSVIPSINRTSWEMALASFLKQGILTMSLSANSLRNLRRLED